ncbi:unnamed protein product, partial [Amoebophrya sp. A25]|eukprot:GSA25T00021333001.1
MRKLLELKPEKKVVLRLLMFWFTYSEDPDLAVKFDGQDKDSDRRYLSAWLFVVPQLVARLRSPRPKLRGQLYHLLRRLVIFFPRVTLFPLTLALSYPESYAQDVARRILVTAQYYRMRQLARETMRVSAELVKLAMLISDLWVAGLESQAGEGAVMWSGDDGSRKAIEKMKQEKKQDLHDADPNNRTETSNLTPFELNFLKLYSEYLLAAVPYVERYGLGRKGKYLLHAWHKFYQPVLQHIQKNATDKLHLKDVAPRLWEMSAPASDASPKNKSNNITLASQSRHISPPGLFTSS